METTTQYLTPAQYRAHKARLTRAVNTGDPHRVLAVVSDTFETWDHGRIAYPDDWHRWERAQMDALMTIRLQGGISLG